MLIWGVASEALRDIITGFLNEVRLTEPLPDDRSAERGAAVVEFVLVSVVALALAMGVAQLGLFLWERNALMGSVSEGARVAATGGRSVADGRQVATELLRRSAGTRVASAVPIQASQAGGLVVLRADGTLPSFVPGVPGLPVHMTAQMHKEESL
jgi:TadE-like protein